MALLKCPRCELNYMKEGERYCSVCRREMKGEEEAAPEVELCSACGERPAAQGEDLCLVCLREIHRLEGTTKAESASADAPLDPLAVSEMDEIEVETDTQDIPSSELGEIDRELSDDDGDEEEPLEEDDMEPASLEQLEEEELDALDEDEDEYS